MTPHEQVAAFRADPNKTKRLAELLADPFYAEATELVRMAATPRLGGQPSVERLAIQHAHAAGCVSVIESYRTLSVLNLEQDEEALAEPFAEYFQGTENLSPQDIEEKVRLRKRKKQ